MIDRALKRYAQPVGRMCNLFIRFGNHVTLDRGKFDLLSCVSMFVFINGAVVSDRGAVDFGMFHSYSILPQIDAVARMARDSPLPFGGVQYVESTAAPLDGCMSPSYSPLLSFSLPTSPIPYSLPLPSPTPPFVPLFGLFLSSFFPTLPFLPLTSPTPLAPFFLSLRRTSLPPTSPAPTVGHPTLPPPWPTPPYPACATENPLALCHRRAVFT